MILGTANHVCLMQWHSAGVKGLVTRRYEARLVIESLAPGMFCKSAKGIITVPSMRKPIIVALGFVSE